MPLLEELAQPPSISTHAKIKAVAPLTLNIEFNALFETGPLLARE
jgi:hypothetical protein